jgi:hypothetical protein
MFERAAVFSALVILFALTLTSLFYYQYLENRQQAEIEIVQEQK